MVRVASCSPPACIALLPVHPCTVARGRMVNPSCGMGIVDAFPWIRCARVNRAFPIPVVSIFTRSWCAASSRRAFASMTCRPRSPSSSDLAASILPEADEVGQP
uniref:Uncharacterized protein n=1 Tax=Arundo donax TaxID=35708 RepID=A0A0A9BKZ8_ARUDO